MIDENNGIATDLDHPGGRRRPHPDLRTPPSGQVGIPYTDTLTAAGGTTPYTWSVSAGTLPAGITLGASTGVLAGTPTAAGTSNFTIKVTDAAGQTATAGRPRSPSHRALTITATASAATATPGSTVGYTVKVTNSGRSRWTGATFTDPLAGMLDDAAYDDTRAPPRPVTFTSPNLTWTGNLAVGASATMTFTVTVNNPDTGDKILAGAITSSTAGSNCAAGGTDPACTLSIPVSILTIVRPPAASTATPAGDTVLHGHGDQFRPGGLRQRRVHRCAGRGTG